MTADQISQRELHGAIAFLYRAAGWTVVELHQNRANPRQMSEPDFLMMRGPVARAVKGLIKGNLSAKQEEAKAAHIEVGHEWRLYYPSDGRDVAEDAA